LQIEIATTHRSSAGGSSKEVQIGFSSGNAAACVLSNSPISPRRLNMQAFKRIGKPDDVGDVIALLASHGAWRITGTGIPVDGGSNLQIMPSGNTGPSGSA
jgi:NAD(P)-dependent dehydrogenase (short-subunit alcohol dehydrogenase family)